MIPVDAFDLLQLRIAASLWLGANPDNPNVLSVSAAIGRVVEAERKAEERSDLLSGEADNKRPNAIDADILALLRSFESR